MKGELTPSHSERSSGFEIVADAAMSRVVGIRILRRATHASSVAPRSSLSMCTSSISTNLVASHMAPQSLEKESHCNGVSASEERMNNNWTLNIPGKSFRKCKLTEGIAPFPA